MGSKTRILAAALTLSAAGLIATATQEHYTDHAVIPTKGDVPTLGFGSTKHADGTPVRMGDTIDPVRALYTVQAHLGREEQAFRDSLPNVYLTQGEYDLYLDFDYQYGIGNWRVSSMRRHLLATVQAQTPVWANEEYRAACDSLLAWRKAGGYDCSTLVNGKPNKRCWGVWERQRARHAKCLSEQEG
jgi:GH24 family phage-related lysozyme (muramidase)